MDTGEESGMPTERKDWHGRPVLTIEELEAMSPEERRADSESRLVTDLSQVPEGYLDDLRAWLTPRIEERDQEASALRRDP
jgi:hypothetical protein